MEQYTLHGAYYTQVSDIDKHNGRIPSAAAAAAYDQVGAIIAFESGELDEEETIELFQHLLDTGLVWNLQGCYGRAAQELLETGAIVRKEGSTNG